MSKLQRLLERLKNQFLAERKYDGVQVGGISADGVDIIQFDEDGLIIDFKVGLPAQLVPVVPALLRASHFFVPALLQQCRILIYGCMTM